ncbi:MAG: hypothetical protein OXH99_05985 [Bryobacterales bacterium]|nr:hypothetical protein [Bryobacterales bacterium]
MKREVGALAESATMMMGWSQLWRNWAFATILGDGQRAVGFLLEAHEINTAMDREDSGELFAPSISKQQINELTLFLSLMLRSNARETGEDAAALPQVFDPEGYIRQRLQFVYEELVSGATAIREIESVGKDLDLTMRWH